MGIFSHLAATLIGERASIRDTSSSQKKNRRNRHAQDSFPDNKVQCADGVYLAPDSIIETVVIIGEGSRVNGPMCVRGSGRLVIGRYAAIGRDLHVITSNHITTTLNIQGALQQRLGFCSVLGAPMDVTIGDATWIGDRVTMLPGSKLGIGSIAGAGSIITKQFMPFSIVAGNPARLIRMRYKAPIAEAILQSRWWEWGFERMQRNRLLFETDLSKFDSAEEFNTLTRD